MFDKNEEKIIDNTSELPYTEPCVKILGFAPNDPSIFVNGSRRQSNRKAGRISRLTLGGVFVIVQKITRSAKRWNIGVHRLQKTCVVWLKQHKTVRALHVFRQYSAFSVVLSSAFLVTGTNLASQENSDGILSGYFHSRESAHAKNLPVRTSEQRESLSMVPLARASNTVDPEAKVDESSILESANLSIVASADLSPVIQKDPEEDGGVKIYTVEEGDTISTIAKNHDITVNTILWANDLDNVDEIRPGDQIFILPIAGLKHIVSEGDTINDIAKKYHGDKDRIIAFNELPADGRLETGQEIIIPDGYKEEAPKPATVFERREYANSSGGSATDISGWRTPEGKAGSGHRFPYGYCTWYVASKRYVPWGGNAGTWLYNAKALGYKTGKSPRAGSIVVTTENRYYGHVALVEKVSGNEITVSEMNYVGWGKTNRRTLLTGSRSIKGYIY